MKLEEDIFETITRVCDQFAGAIERYDNMSGGILPPEQVIVSHILMELGDVLTMTGETNGGTLWSWNGTALERRGKPQPGGNSPSPAYAQFRQRRVDLVIYKGDHTRKNEMEFLCLVEFKLGYVDQRDLDKLRDMLPHLITCQYGAICTALRHPQHNDYRGRCEAAAKQAGRIPVRGRVAHPLWSQPKDWQTYAEILKNPNYIPPP